MLFLYGGEDLLAGICIMQLTTRPNISSRQHIRGFSCMLWRQRMNCYQLTVSKKKNTLVILRYLTIDYKPHYLIYLYKYMLLCLYVLVHVNCFSRNPTLGRLVTNHRWFRYACITTFIFLSLTILDSSIVEYVDMREFLLGAAHYLNNVEIDWSVYFVLSFFFRNLLLRDFTL